MTPQQTQIINLLSDGEYHCPTAELFMKDDRKRISELRKMGYEFDSPPCDKKCGINHSSRVVMRRLMAEPTIPLPEAKNALRADFDSQERLWGQNSVAIANFAKSALQKPLFEYFGMPSH